MSAGSEYTCNSSVDPLGMVCNTGVYWFTAGEAGCSRHGAFLSSVLVGGHNSH